LILLRRWLAVVAVFLFTAPDGRPVFIESAQVAAIQRPPPGSGVCQDAPTIIDTLAKSYCVREAPEDVARKLRWKP
jgi:hypothetical protein